MARSLNHPRGCPCDPCERRRVYSREYQRRKRGVPAEGVPYARGRAENLGGRAKPKGEPDPYRMFETPNGENVTVHWLPKPENPEDEWTCPHCGTVFKKVDGIWG